MTKLLTVPEAAEFLNVQPRYIRRLVHEKRIEVVRIGRHIRLDQRELDRLIEAGRQPARPE